MAPVPHPQHGRDPEDWTGALHPGAADGWGLFLKIVMGFLGWPPWVIGLVHRSRHCAT